MKPQKDHRNIYVTSNLGAATAAAGGGGVNNGTNRHRSQQKPSIALISPSLLAKRGGGGSQSNPNNSGTDNADDKSTRVDARQIQKGHSNDADSSDSSDLSHPRVAHVGSGGDVDDTAGVQPSSSSSSSPPPTALDEMAKMKHLQELLAEGRRRQQQEEEAKRNRSSGGNGGINNKASASLLESIRAQQRQQQQLSSNKYTTPAAIAMIQQAAAVAVGNFNNNTYQKSLSSAAAVNITNSSNRDNAFSSSPPQHATRTVAFDLGGGGGGAKAAVSAASPPRLLQPLTTSKEVTAEEEEEVRHVGKDAEQQQYAQNDTVKNTATAATNATASQPPHQHTSIAAPPPPPLLLARPQILLDLERYLRTELTKLNAQYNNAEGTTAASSSSHLVLSNPAQHNKTLNDAITLPAAPPSNDVLSRYNWDHTWTLMPEDDNDDGDNDNDAIVEGGGVGKQKLRERALARRDIHLKRFGLSKETPLTTRGDSKKKNATTQDGNLSLLTAATAVASPSLTLDAKKDAYRNDRMRIFSAAAKIFADQFKSYRKLLLWILLEYDGFVSYCHEEMLPKKKKKRTNEEDDVDQGEEEKRIMSQQLEEQRNTFESQLSQKNDVITSLKTQIEKLEGITVNGRRMIHDRDEQLEVKEKELIEAAEGRVALLSRIQRLEKELWHQKELSDEPERKLRMMSREVCDLQDRLKATAKSLQEAEDNCGRLRSRLEQSEEALRERRNSEEQMATRAQYQSWKRREVELLELNAQLQSQNTRLSAQLDAALGQISRGRGDQQSSSSSSTPRPMWSLVDRTFPEATSTAQRVRLASDLITRLSDELRRARSELNVLRGMYTPSDPVHFIAPVGNLPLCLHEDQWLMHRNYLPKLGLDTRIPSFLKGVGKAINYKLSRDEVTAYCHLLWFEREIAVYQQPNHNQSHQLQRSATVPWEDTVSHVLHKFCPPIPLETLELVKLQKQRQKEKIQRRKSLLLLRAEKGENNNANIIGTNNNSASANGRADDGSIGNVATTRFQIEAAEKALRVVGGHLQSVVDDGTGSDIITNNDFDYVGNATAFGFNTNDSTKRRRSQALSTASSSSDPSSPATTQLLAASLHHSDVAYSLFYAMQWYQFDPFIHFTRGVVLGFLDESCMTTVFDAIRRLKTAMLDRAQVSDEMVTVVAGSGDSEKDTDDDVASSPTTKDQKKKSLTSASSKKTSGNSNSNNGSKAIPQLQLSAQEGGGGEGVTALSGGKPQWLSREAAAKTIADVFPLFSARKINLLTDTLMHAKTSSRDPRLINVPSLFMFDSAKKRRTPLVTELILLKIEERSDVVQMYIDALNKCDSAPSIRRVNGGGGGGGEDEGEEDDAEDDQRLGKFAGGGGSGFDDHNSGAVMETINMNNINHLFPLQQRGAGAHSITPHALAKQLWTADPFIPIPHMDQLMCYCFGHEIELLAHPYSFSASVVVMTNAGDAADNDKAKGKRGSPTSPSPHPSPSLSSSVNAVLLAAMSGTAANGSKREKKNGAGDHEDDDDDDEGDASSLPNLSPRRMKILQQQRTRDEQRRRQRSFPESTVRAAPSVGKRYYVDAAEVALDYFTLFERILRRPAHRFSGGKI